MLEKRSAACQLSERFQVRRAGNAALGDDRADEPCGRDVERRVRRGHIRSNANPLNVRDLGGRAFFNGNLLAGGNGQVERGGGRLPCAAPKL